MKYFKHHTERDREFLDLVFQRFGHEGISVWWGVLEILSIEIERQVDEFRYGRSDFISPIMTVDLNWLANKCKTKTDIVQALTEFARESGKLSVAKLAARGAKITIEAPNLLDDSDEYFQKAIGKICKARDLDPKKVPTLSGHCRDSVGRVSRQCPTKQDNNKQDKTKQEQPPAPSPKLPQDPLPKAEAPGGGVGEPPPPAPPSPPPRLAAAVVVAPAPQSVALGDPATAPAIEQPHFGVGLSLLLSVGVAEKPAKSFASSLPVREIAAVARGARGVGVQDPAAWARRACERRFERNKPLSSEAAAELLLEIDRHNRDAVARIGGPLPGETLKDYHTRVLHRPKTGNGKTEKSGGVT